MDLIQICFYGGDGFSFSIFLWRKEIYSNKPGQNTEQNHTSDDDQGANYPSAIGYREPVSIADRCNSDKYSPDGIQWGRDICQRGR